MGSPLRLTLGGTGARRIADDGRSAWDGVVASFETSEDAMSRFRETSEITAFNRFAGRSVAGRPSSRLRQALVAADRARRVTGGRFDPSVLVDLDRLGYRGAALPDVVPLESDTTRVVERCGRHDVSLPRPVDLGGIGKGLALRWAAAQLTAGGLTDFLLEAGGDLVGRGTDASGEPWYVGIEDPAGGDDLAVIAALDAAVATSSIRVNHWTVDGRTVHHLIDPRTHEPADVGLGRGLVQGPVPRRAPVDRDGGPVPRARRLVGDRRRHARDDAGGAGDDGLGRGRGCTTRGRRSRRGHRPGLRAVSRPGRAPARRPWASPRGRPVA
jgi:thiamine biosynthesis lipoprotein ApbE